MVNRSMLVRRQGHYIDVTGYKIVIWGVGKDVREMSFQLQLDEIDMVVDKSTNLHGETINLYGREYVVEPPSSLKIFNNDKVLIILGCNVGIDEIREQAESVTGKKDYICVKANELYGYYDSVESLLLYDPVMSRKVAEGNISCSLSGYIQKLKEIIAHGTEDFEKSFIPIRGGARISFIIATKEFVPRYVMHFPVRKYREENNSSDARYISEAYELKKKLRFDKEIKLYEDESGFELEIFGEIINDWSNVALVEKVIRQIRQIHDTPIRTQMIRDPWDRLISVEKYIKKLGIDFPWDISAKIHEALCEEIKRYTPTLCHGDFTCDNVIEIDGKLVLIDWEWIGMSDTLNELGHFFITLKYHGCGSVIGKNEVLNIYLGRCPSETETRHFEAILVYEEYMTYCSYLLTGANRGKSNTEVMLMEMVNKFKI